MFYVEYFATLHSHMLRSTFGLFARYMILAVYYLILAAYCSRAWNCRFIIKFMSNIACESQMIAAVWQIRM